MFYKDQARLDANTDLNRGLLRHWWGSLLPGNEYLHLSHKIQNTKWKIQNTKWKVQHTKYKISTSIGAFYGTDEVAYYREMNTSICHTIQNEKPKIQNTKWKIRHTKYKIPTSIGAFYGTDEEAYYQEMNTSICHTKYTGASYKRYNNCDIWKTYERPKQWVCGMK